MCGYAAWLARTYTAGILNMSRQGVIPAVLQGARRPAATAPITRTGTRFP